MTAPRFVLAATCVGGEQITWDSLLAVQAYWRHRQAGTGRGEAPVPAEGAS